MAESGRHDGRSDADADAGAGRAGRKGRYLVVGRLRKPHGLKGDVSLFPLSDSPETVFAPGNQLWLLNLEGEVVGGPLTVERSRGYHREWLVKFAAIDGRDQLEQWRGLFLGADETSLRPLEGDEVYVDDLAGYSVRALDGTPLGLVTAVYELPAGLTIEVQGPKREFLLPYKKEFVRQVEREARRLVVAPPPGLVDE
jgi:16S rRNA processing protein RimM